MPEHIQSAALDVFGACGNAGTTQFLIFKSI